MIKTQLGKKPERKFYWRFRHAPVISICSFSWPTTCCMHGTCMVQKKRVYYRLYRSLIYLGNSLHNEMVAFQYEKCNVLHEKFKLWWGEMQLRCLDLRSRKNQAPPNTHCPLMIKSEQVLVLSLNYGGGGHWKLELSRSDVENNHKPPE